MEQPDLRIPTRGADQSNRVSDQELAEACAGPRALPDHTTPIAAEFHQTVGDFLVPRRPAKVTQADIARALRAAKAAGANSVTIDGGGVIRIAFTASAGAIKPANDLDGIWTPSEALQHFLKHTESG